MSADPTTVPDLDLEDEQYNSEEDEDFQLDTAAGQDDDDGLSSSDSDDDAGTGEPGTKKRKAGKHQDADEEELGSGDEAMIQKAKAKKAKGKKKQKKSKESGGAKGDDDEDDEDDVDFDDEEEGGPGGFVRTRAMKMRTQEERKPLAKIDGATVDVDALWAKMNAPDTGSGPDASEETQENTPLADGDTNDTAMQDLRTEEPSAAQSKSKYAEEMVKIKRTYKFAGEMITEEKLVPKDSAEAKIYLASGNDAETVPVADADAERENVKAALNLRRPLRKLSRFDPNPTGSIKKSWEKQPAAAQAPGMEENARGPKINTVEKSRLDWAAYVDQAGIKDELKVHSRAKEGFLGRMDFLDRVGANREEEARNARLKGM